MINHKLAALVGVLTLTLSLGIPVAAETIDAMPAQRLTCRLMAGGWQPCTLRLDPDGMGWQLSIGSQLSIRFHHDGRGRVRMQSESQPWRLVEARWLADASLCWDGVCARGPIPLD